MIARLRQSLHRIAQLDRDLDSEIGPHSNWPSKKTSAPANYFLVFPHLPTFPHIDVRDLGL